MNEEEMRKEENLEHEVLDRLKSLDTTDFDYNKVHVSYVDAMLKARDIILDLYNKEKAKNKELEEYANWHIEHLTEDIADYIDDDRKGNAIIIGELKEDRQHWRDIIRINNNEKTYIDYKNY